MKRDLIKFLEKKQAEPMEIGSTQREIIRSVAEARGKNVESMLRVEIVGPWVNENWDWKKGRPKQD